MAPDSRATSYYYYDTHNRRTGFSYDNAGNLTFDGGQTFTYDATGQQTNASYTGYSLQQAYDGDGLRVKKVDNGWTTYYLRSSVLGGQVVAEINWYSVAWGWTRGYVYAGSQLLAVQQSSSVNRTRMTVPFWSYRFHHARIKNAKPFGLR